MGRPADLVEWTNRRLAALGHEPVELPDRPERALVGFDGQPSSRNAGLWAGEIASRLHLLTVEPSSRPGTVRAGDVSNPREEAQRLQEMVSQARPRLEEALEGIPIELEWAQGRPSEEIREAAGRLRAGLLAVGYNNTRDPTKPYGSVAEKLMHEAEPSTLVTRHAPRTGPVTGALGTDEGTRSAAAWAAGLAAWLGQPLRLVHAEETAPDGFEDEQEGARALRVDWPPAFGLSNLEEEAPSSLVVLGERVIDGGLGSTAVQIARRCNASLFVARRRGPADPSRS